MKLFPQNWNTMHCCQVHLYITFPNTIVQSRCSVNVAKFILKKTRNPETDILIPFSEIQYFEYLMNRRLDLGEWIGLRTAKYTKF